MSFFPTYWNTNTFNPYFTPSFFNNPSFYGFNPGFPNFQNNAFPGFFPFNGYNWNGFTGHNFNNGFNAFPFAYNYNQPSFGFNWWNQDQGNTFSGNTPQNFTPFANGFSNQFNGTQAA